MAGPGAGNQLSGKLLVGGRGPELPRGSWPQLGSFQAGKPSPSPCPAPAPSPTRLRVTSECPRQQSREASPGPAARGPFLDLLSTPETGCSGSLLACFVWGGKGGRGRRSLWPVRIPHAAHRVAAREGTPRAWMLLHPGPLVQQPSSGCWDPLFKDRVTGTWRGLSHSPEVWGLY